FVFNHATVADINDAIGRALELYENDQVRMKKMREKMLRFDHSWENSIQQYMDVYESVIE
ncbi:MAG: glycogen synthase, partial [Bacteroidota bacterium]